MSIIDGLLNLKGWTGDSCFELVLICALAAIILIPLGIKLSQRALTDKGKTDSKTGGKS
jgi:hypothetical protein